jgi:hypothetical protein
MRCERQRGRGHPERREETLLNKRGIVRVHCGSQALPEQGCPQVRIDKVAARAQRSFPCNRKHTIDVVDKGIAVHLKAHEERNRLVELHALR